MSVLADAVKEFVADVAVPAEQELGLGEPSEALRCRLQVAARERGVFAPQVPRPLGGLGLALPELRLVFEAAGYGLLGPLALNCAAPDEGNIHLLDLLATAEQRVKYLEPLAAGEVRSGFAMTEPAPGAGSDPSLLLTRAERTRAGWHIVGRKWLITGADGAAFTICVAKTSERRATLFVVDADAEGFHLVRRVPTIDHLMPGGHCELEYDCHVGHDAVLGEVGEGLRHTQARLVPARLTHCMRWLGVAQRALDTALTFTAPRNLFGSRLHELGLAQGLIADSVIDIEASRALVARACEEPSLATSSVAKVFVAEAVWRVVDRAVQLAGGAGVTHDLVLARLAAEVRAFRIYDGSSETHRWAIARAATKRFASSAQQ